MTRSSGWSFTLSEPTRACSEERWAGDASEAGIGSLAKSATLAGSFVTSMSIADFKKARKAGLSLWRKETPSSPHPHHFICFTTVIISLSDFQKLAETIDRRGGDKFPGVAETDVDLHVQGS